MVTFILNNRLVTTASPDGSPLLDYLRYEADLPGTKAGCREGDCGACTVVEGSAEGERVVYRSIVSCLTPLVNIHGKHIVTIEGLEMNNLSPVQQAISEFSATQCGFCTPGFVMSLTALCLAPEKPDLSRAIDSVAGNICRCTGYKSIEKAVVKICQLLASREEANHINWLIDNNFIPGWFTTIPERLKKILPYIEPQKGHKTIIVSGGTDTLTKKELIYDHHNFRPLAGAPELKGISISGKDIKIGASVTISELMASETINNAVHDFGSFKQLVASEQIRNMGTLAGNIANASPAADLSVMLLVLGPVLHISGQGKGRIVALDSFYHGYKITDLKAGELISAISFSIPTAGTLFNFEKTAKRTHLDIAAVNTAILLNAEEGLINSCTLSAGGVFPYPLRLRHCEEYIAGKKISPSLLIAANEIMQSEISPISDIRGTASYKRLLLRQLFFAHFIRLLPEIFGPDEIRELLSAGHEEY